MGYSMRSKVLLKTFRAALSLVLVFSFVFTDLGHILTFNALPKVSEVQANTIQAIRVESFDRNVTTDGSTFSLINDVGATSSAFVRMNTGTRKTSAGPTGSQGTIAPNVGTAGLVLTGTNEITVQRVDATEVKMMGEVWRYQGFPGDTNEFIVRGREVISLTGTDASVSVSGIGDVDKVIPFITGYTVDSASSNDWDSASIAAHMNDSGDLVVSRNNSTIAATVYVDVVEFVGSDWTVCHGYSNAHDTAEQTITLNTDSDGQGGSTCDVTDWSTATILEATMEGDSVETGLSDTLALVRPGLNTTSVVFDVQQDTNARNDGEAWIHVLQNDALVVTRASDANAPEGNGTYSTAVWPTGAATDASLDSLSLEWFSDTSGVGSAHMRGGLHARIAQIGVTVYGDGALVPSTDYDETITGEFTGVLTFAASPQGVVYEAGGNGIGTFVGFNDSGDFVIRAGNGTTVAPVDAARIVITPSDYDFSSRTGTLSWTISPGTNSVDLAFDDGSNGSIEFSTSTTAASPWTTWSGADDGNVGNSNGNVAGNEVAVNFDFNGTINEVQFSQGLSGQEIEHWIHRTGNNVGIEYGIIELSGLTALNDTTLVTVEGTQVTTATIPTNDVEMGGTFVIADRVGSRNITNVTISETGTIDAQNGLDNIELYYDIDTSFPYDCSSESFSGTGSETQFGTTDTNGFSGANGASSFSGVASISTTATFCGYVVYDVTQSAQNGETIELSIETPSTDVVVTNSGSVGPATAVDMTGVTTVQNAELTQTNYHWRNDDGNETNTGATSIEGAENTPAAGFTNGITKRLRVQVSAEGSVTSAPTQYRLEYAEKITTCAAAATWTDVGVGGIGDWDMVNTPNLTDGNDTTLITNAGFGAMTPANTTRLVSNGGQKDTSSQTANITLTNTEFVELEFAIEPTVSAPQGNTYCFRVSDAGTPLRNYNVYAEGTISADVEVSAVGSHVTSLNAGSLAQYLGGSYAVTRTGGARTVTSLTISEVGTIDAAADIENVSIFYDLDETAPYDCVGESYAGTELQFGLTDSDGFSAANGIATFSDTETVSTARAMCLYVVLDVASDAQNSETIEVQINNPATEVVVTASSVGPSTAVAPTGSTTVAGSIMTQTHYHWRNDNGDETDAGATSATGGSQDTAITDVKLGSSARLRLQVSNEGSVSSAANQYVLEYGTKSLSCDLVGTWRNVGASGGAFDMVLSPNITDGNTTDINNAANGAMTEENTTFVGSGALRETSATSSAIALSSTQYAELEYSISVTEDAGFDTTYCFRVSAAGAPLPVYTNYAELTTTEKQDFFIQRGSETITGTGITLTAGVDYTAPSATTSAFVRITSSHMTGAGNNLGTNGQPADDVTAYISNQSDITTSFTISRPSSATSNTRVDWEIIEFIGLPGTDNEIKVRGVGEVAFTATEFIDSGAIVSDVTNASDVAVFITGQQNQDTGTGNYNDGLFTARWNNITTRPEFQRGDADSSADLGYAVVEFTGANWKVQRIEHTYTTSGIVETEPMNAVGSIFRSFVHAQKRVGEGLNGIDEGGHLVFISSIGAVSFQLRGSANTPSDHVSIAWVIENTQTGTGAMTTYQSSGAFNNADPEPASYSVPIGGTVNLSNASIFGNNTTDGTGTTYPRLHTGFTILSTTTYQVFRSDTNNDMDFRVEVIVWPVAETSIRQNYYRFYVDNDALDPTDPWPLGANDLGENTSITGSDDPLGEGERVRLRMSLLINNATLPQSTTAFKLQYGLQAGTCSAVSVWTDVGAPGSGTIWRGSDGTPIDGTALATSSPAAGTLNLSVSDVAGTYEEANTTAVNPYLVDIGQDVEYDWLLEHNGAAQRSDYCFRMVYADDSELNSYIHYPTLRTTGYTPIIWDWRWYNDESNETPSSPLAAENVAPVDVGNQEIIKLRVIASEVENSVGQDVKFALQYSQYADFSDGGTFLESINACTATSTWCYADGAGVDNAVIQSSVITKTDTCVAGVGIGCGTHNEVATTTSTFTHAASANTEFEFTLRQAAARVNGVYYFRLYDVTIDQPLVASSSLPSLVTEGAQLVATISGVTVGTEVAGITADVTTTAASIGFGSLPVNASFEAVQRLSISTNATQGYQLLMYATQQLTNSYGEIIPAITSSNAIPAGWSSVCTSLVTGCFGYHTTDATLLSGNRSRFGPIDSYAAVSTEPAEIMFSSIPANDTQDIVYRILVSEMQSAGEYQTSIVYIAIPTF